MVRLVLSKSRKICNVDCRLISKQLLELYLELESNEIIANFKRDLV